MATAATGAVSCTYVASVAGTSPNSIRYQGTGRKAKVPSAGDSERSKGAVSDGSVLVFVPVTRSTWWPSCSVGSLDSIAATLPVQVGSVMATSSLRCSANTGGSKSAQSIVLN